MYRRREFSEVSTRQQTAPTWNAAKPPLSTSVEQTFKVKEIKKSAKTTLYHYVVVISQFGKFSGFQYILVELLIVRDWEDNLIEQLELLYVVWRYISEFDL